MGSANGRVLLERWATGVAPLRTNAKEWLRVRIPHVGRSEYPVLRLGIAGAVPGACILACPAIILL